MLLDYFSLFEHRHAGSVLLFFMLHQLKPYRITSHSETIEMQIA